MTQLSKAWSNLWDSLSREPVLGFGAAGLAITAWGPSTWTDTDAKKAALAAVILFFQRAWSKSTKAVAEQVEVAAYTGAVEHQATALAGRLLRNHSG